MAKKSAKKNKKEILRPGKKSPPLKKILPLAIAVILILIPYFFLKNSSYFKISDIKVVDKTNASGLGVNDLLRIYKGRNIFDINIDSVSSEIKNEYPVIKDALVKRALPNRLEIDIVPRIPVAKIKSRMYFPVDRDGMVLSPNIKSENLPVIIGYSTWKQPKVGERLKNKQLDSAFLLLDAMQRSSVSSDYAVTTIDVSNYENISFYLENGIEVKMGGEDFPARLKMLESTLDNENLDRENIKYIDLRFKDVVIGPK